MVPKPFPYPIEIGVDICNVNRLARLLVSPSLRNRWARKVFTRLEWPLLKQSFKKVQMAHPSSDTGPKIVYESVNRRNEDLWTLPPIVTRMEKSEGVTKQASLDTILSDRRSPLLWLARHLAGRWAAKEAVIKAHWNRRLYMREISIVNPHDSPYFYSEEFAKENKLMVLIDPPTDTILMDERVASIRALRGFGPRSRNLQKDKLLMHTEDEISVTSKFSGDQRSDGMGTVDGAETYFKRRAKIDESQRQIAQISISHDDDMAVATCMAVDQQDPGRPLKQIIDDGSSGPIHEPQWGDEEWFN